MEIKHAIIESAIVLSYKTGFYAASTPKIADEAGASELLIYNHCWTETERTMPNDLFAIPVPDQVRDEGHEIRNFPITKKI